MARRQWHSAGEFGKLVGELLWSVISFRNISEVVNRAVQVWPMSDVA